MNGEGEQHVPVAPAGVAPAEHGLTRALAVARSWSHWALCAGFFFPVSAVLVLLGIFVDPRKNDAPQRFLCRVTMKLAGAKLAVRRSLGFDPGRTCFFLVNHVNLFDPFVLYATIPQFFRGLELESHFRIPVYGWMMKRFGNIPVADNPQPADLRRMWRLTRAALDSGISLAAFPEGSRTVTGRVGPFKEGVLRMALQFRTPIVPVSLVGAFEFNRKTDWMLRPGTITVHLHDTIETAGLRKEDLPALRDRLQRIISQPVDEALNASRSR